MKKLLLLALTLFFFITLGVLSWVIGESIINIASYPYDVLIWIGIMLGFIYLARNEKDSLVHIFKDIHQSNLDDIEEHQLEENIESISVKKEVQTSLKKIFKNTIGLGIAASILWVVGLAFGIVEFNDGSFKYLILSVPGVLIVSYLIVKSYSITRVLFTADVEQKQEAK